MDHDGGGWTLIMKLAAGSTFAFDSPLWTTEEVLAPDDLLPNTGQSTASDAKLTAFNRIPGAELRLEFIEPEQQEFRFLLLANRTALEAFQGPEQLVVGSERRTCHGPLLRAASGYSEDLMRHGRGPQFFGINGQNSKNGRVGRIRFGFGSNDEGVNEWAARQGIGSHASSIQWHAQDDCSDGCGCYGLGSTIPEPVGNFWVR